MSESVPLLDLKAQYQSIASEIDAAIQGVVQSQRFVLGEEVAALESEIASYCDVLHAVGCASGSDALLLALMAHGIGRGDAVLVPTYTFFATAGTVWRLGAEPVFVDIDPVSYNFDPASARLAAEGRKDIRALLPVNLYGQMADLEAVERLAADLGVPVIEDSAQAIGAFDERGRRAGASGALSCLSFFPSKNLGGYGDGGMVTCGEAELADRVDLLRTHGARPKYEHAVVGLNSRLDAIQAAVLRVKLRHLERWHEARIRNADHYDEMFAAAGASDSRTRLAEGGLPLRFPARPGPRARHIFNQYVIRVPEETRDALRAHLSELEIGTAIYYPIPLHLQACFASLGHRQGDLPESEAAAKGTLALPIYPELSKEQRERVASVIVDFIGRRRP